MAAPAPPGRTIVVGQRSLEHAGLEFAALELWRPGDELVLVHAAAVLPPSSVTLHSAPHTTYSVDPQLDPAALLAKVSKAVKSRVIAKVEAPAGMQVSLKVELQPSQDWGLGLVRDAAEAIVAAARAAGASLLVLAREEGDGGGGGGGGAGDEAAAAADEQVCAGAQADAPAGPLAAAAGVVGRMVADVQRARGALRQKLVVGPSLVEEVLSRAEGLPVVLVPASYGSAGAAAGGEGEASGGGAAGAVAQDPSPATAPPPPLPPAGWRPAARRALAAALWDVIDPRGGFRKRWDLLLLLEVAFLVIMVPFVMCFGITYGTNQPISIIELVIDVTFLADIWLSFRTGILDMRTHTVDTDHRTIARRYLRTWFLPDLLTALPYEWLLLGGAELVQLVKAVRLMKILRMLRLVKLVKLGRSSLLMHHIAHKLGPHLLQLAKLCLAAATLTHYITCFFYYAALLEGDGPNWASDFKVQDKSTAIKYVSSLYWTVSTLGTVGYGDVRPTTTGERVLAILAILLGLTVFASFVSSVSRLVDAMDGRAAKARRKLQARPRGPLGGGQLDAFLRHRAVPRPLMRRISEYHRVTAARQLTPDELAVVDELSAPLRTELVMFLFRGVLERVPFFHGRGGGFIAAVVTRLRLEYFAPGDVVTREGESGDHMWFVAEGDLEVHLYCPQQPPPPDGAPLLDGAAAAPGPRAAAPPLPQRRRLSAGGGAAAPPGPYRLLGALRGGDRFGEWSALLGQRRAATVVAVSPCECYSLSRASVAALLARWPELTGDFEAMLQFEPGKAGGFVPGGAGGPVTSSGMPKRFVRSHLQELARSSLKQAGGLSRGSGSFGAAAAGAWRLPLRRPGQNGPESPRRPEFGSAPGGSACPPMPTSRSSAPGSAPQWQRAARASLSARRRQQREGPAGGGAPPPAPGGGAGQAGAKAGGDAPPALRPLRRPSLVHDFSSLAARGLLLDGIGGGGGGGEGLRSARASQGAPGYQSIGRSSMPSLRRPQLRAELPRTISVGQHSLLAAAAGQERPAPLMSMWPPQSDGGPERVSTPANTHPLLPAAALLLPGTAPQMGKQTFCALRCHACARFCVQLQKQSIKWQCPGCGARQSVLRVFAVGDAAKDVRLVVQALNAARGDEDSILAQRPPPQPQQGPAGGGVGDARAAAGGAAPRWQEFAEGLEEEAGGEDDWDGGGGGGGGGGAYVTALPGEGAARGGRQKRRGGGGGAGDFSGGGGGGGRGGGKRARGAPEGFEAPGRQAKPMQPMGGAGRAGPAAPAPGGGRPARPAAWDDFVEEEEAPPDNDGYDDGGGENVWSGGGGGGGVWGGGGGGSGGGGGGGGGGSGAWGGGSSGVWAGGGGGGGWGASVDTQYG
ncbi:MAG: hypothetical protein J3K34DRAFT_462033 [Monoraphidium minutum]|nr:MAG: hypothetical protein J3K34DRAFT_462033 [Monoraphidium minutum]